MTDGISSRLWHTLPCGFLQLDEQDRITAWNDTLAQWSRIPAPEAVGRPLLELAPERARLSRILARVRSSGQPRLLSQALHGHFIPVKLAPERAEGFDWMQQECQVVPLVEPAGHLGISIVDVTAAAAARQRVRALRHELQAAQENASRALRDREQLYAASVRREERYRSMVDTLREIVFQTNLSGQWTFLNPVWAEITGFPVEETLGTAALDYVLTEDREKKISALRRVEQHAVDHVRFEVRYRTPDGAFRWIEELIQQAFDRTGQPIGWSGTLNDITHRKRTEEQLLASSRLLDAIRQAQSQFINDSSTRDIFAFLLDALLHITGSEYGFIAELFHDPDGSPYLKAQAITNIAWDEEARRLHDQFASTGLEFRNLQTLFGAVVTTQQPVISNDPANDPRRGGLPRGHPPLRAFLGLPVAYDGQLVGSIGIANRNGGYDDALIAFLQPLLATCAQVINGYRLEGKRRQAEAAVREARDAAEAASRAKSEFMAKMSHEIRTPLNGLLGFAELLVDSPLDPTQRESAAIIRDSGSALLAIINDILDFAKIEAGRLEIEKAPFDPQPILSGVLKLFDAAVRKNGLTLHQAGTIAPGLQVVGDSGRFRQVLTNLVGNAVKFTERGGVTVTVTIESAESSLVRLAVSDTGIGIPPEKQSLLFQEFSQVDGSATRKFGGTGLGLAISRRLVELMGGSIGCTSADGRGSTFWFTIPVAPPAPRANVAGSPVHALALPGAAPGPAEAARAAVRRRILVVEDNRTNQILAARLLAKLGCEVEIARNGAEAVQAAGKNSYDLIFMDCHMPEMDGHAATQAIRNLPGAASQVPIVALTASVLAEDRRHCLEVGMNDFLPKPIEKELLSQALTRWCPEPDKP